MVTSKNPLLLFMLSLNLSNYEDFVKSTSLPESIIYEKGLNVFKHNIPLWIFFIASFILAFYCYKYKLSIIPVLGLISCLFMMSEMGISNWTGFGIWLIVGLIIYALYGFRKSKLNKLIR
jgi:hypothetical protein